MPIRRKNGRRRGWMLTVLAFLGTAWIGGLIAFAEAIPRGVPEEGTERTDAIVVLTGGSLRLETGVALLERGVADKLFVSGVYRGVDVADLLRRQNRQPDRFECCVVLGHDAADTVGNAAETAAWAEDEGLNSLRIVTAGYHMPRSLLEFRAAMPGVVLLPHPVSPDHVKLDQWYRFPGTAALIAGEYTKFLLAWVRQTAKAGVTDVTNAVRERR